MEGDENMKRRDFFALAGAATLPAFAQGAWPERPVKLVLSQPAGSGPDILAAARSAPDGYTFFYATTAAMVTNAFTFKSLPYDPVKDFVPVRLVGRSPFIIAAATSFAVKDFGEAMAKAKAQPGGVTIATEGPKTFSGMLADMVAQMAGVKLNHVPYTKATDAMQDVIGGRVQLVCLPDAALNAYMKAGQVKPLAVSSPTRIQDLPQVPSLSETFAGFEYTGWNGVFAPAGTPADIVARMNRDLESVLSQTEVAQRLQSLGSQAEPRMTVAQFDAFMRSERERWGKVVKAVGITPE
jgi:tripartite-type tricarboxylate transporter receptor subunit TctC